MAQIEPLFALGYIVDHTHSSNEVDHFTRGCVVEVVATLVSTVTVHPLQTELALGGCLVGHEIQRKLELSSLVLLGQRFFTTLTDITSGEVDCLDLYEPGVEFAFFQLLFEMHGWEGREGRDMQPHLQHELHAHAP